MGGMKTTDADCGEDGARREIAQRVFKALCARFPDRYVVLIEPPRDLYAIGVADVPPLVPA
jgi:hypothetical protein